MSGVISNKVKAGFYPWLVVLLLMFAYMLSFVDRQIISLLVDPIRADLQITDTQISLLQGLAFALFYTLMGIPIAKLADVRSRRNIIVWGICIWSMMTAFCGIAKNYWVLFVGRLGVGVGEAALSPASYSMISDYFDEKQLSTALSLYGMGPYLGSGLAYILGGSVVSYLDSLDKVVLPFFGEVSSWQAAFISVGLPGVLVAFLILFVIKEPKRPFDNQSGSIKAEFVRDVIPFMMKHKKFYVCHAMGMGLMALIAYSSLSWLPSFYVRVFKLEIIEVARNIGLLIMVFGTLGIFAGGRLSDYLQTKKSLNDGAMRSACFAALLIPPIILGAVLSDSAPLSFVFVAGVFFLVAFPFGAGVAALQTATPPQFRAQVSAVYLFVNNVVGLALGPTAVAVFTDYVFKSDQAVGMSIGIVGALSGVAAFIFCLQSLKPLRSMLLANEVV